MSLAKVKGIGGLRKDMRTGAVISTDAEALQAAQRRAQDAQTIETLTDRVGRLEAALTRLLQERADGTDIA